MRLRGQDDDQLDVRVSIEELMLLRTVLHEVCNGMNFSENDFQAIFGVNRGEIDALLLHAEGMLDRLRLTSE